MCLPLVAVAIQLCAQSILLFLFLCHGQTLRKKGFNGCDSPEPDGEDSVDQSPLNDDTYRKNNEDLDVLFKRYSVSCPLPTPILA